MIIWVDDRARLLCCAAKLNSTLAVRGRAQSNVQWAVVDQEGLKSGAFYTSQHGFARPSPSFTRGGLGSLRIRACGWLASSLILNQVGLVW